MNVKKKTTIHCIKRVQECYKPIMFVYHVAYINILKNSSEDAMFEVEILTCIDITLQNLL